MAVMLPKCQKGGESEKLSARKPMMVVSEVMVTGIKLTRTASTMAAFFSIPSRIKPFKDIRMCKESAIAKVRIMVGADAAIGVSLIPKKPAIPIPNMEDRMITNKVAKVAVTERMINNVMTMITRNINGTNVPMSPKPASANALFNIDTPLI